MSAQASSPSGASPKSGSKSPRTDPNSPHHPQDDLIPADPELDNGDDDDNDSALGDENTSSTASVASSILNYRTINGRTFHSERHNLEYFAPNDERQNESVDITHHYLTLLLGGKLFLAPIKDNIHRVLDIGTGTGIWSIDFADLYPGASVTGTDLSPIQPTWVPPNVRFEIDDATQPWTWPENHFDFVHLRYLFGSISDWPELFRQAFFVCAPGGWVESGECEVDFISDDGTVEPDSALATWGRMCSEAGKKIGRPFTVVADGLQRKGLEEAGFVDIQEVDYKLPVGGWPQNRYSFYLWNAILQWPKDEYQIFLMRTRKELKNKNIHSYLRVKYVYARKPTSS
ncbi:S-adenosyl-L-methionine-dependent methyltransferase [Cercophora scortea]|uniref:S-adenosyl-L-methionine-dependent methyltransferase n=1 Tax=Cercophora scortea TaxID=314031 RepID=A0AAE0MI33_9PEZI|nr:S-adenosyl-L-methionine-dependent methyltransferase [Cercophora scortea]